MDPLLASLLIWICLQIGCQPPAPPEVRLVAGHELAELLYGGEAPKDAVVCGLYDCRSRVLHLPRHWRADSLADRSSLVHELVHHVQVVTGMSYPCRAAGERLAYDLQARWLKQNGVEDPYALMKVDEFTIRARSLCPEPE